MNKEKIKGREKILKKLKKFPVAAKVSWFEPAHEQFLTNRHRVYVEVYGIKPYEIISKREFENLIKGLNMNQFSDYRKREDYHIIAENLGVCIEKIWESSRDRNSRIPIGYSAAGNSIFNISPDMTNFFGS